LCSVYKVYKILNLKGDLIKNKINFYAVKQNIEKTKVKKRKKSTEEGDTIISHFNHQLKELGKKIKTILTY